METGKYLLYDKEHFIAFIKRKEAPVRKTKGPTGTDIFYNRIFFL